MQHETDIPPPPSIAQVVAPAKARLAVAGAVMNVKKKKVKFGTYKGPAEAAKQRKKKPAVAKAAQAQAAQAPADQAAAANPAPEAVQWAEAVERAQSVQWEEAVEWAEAVERAEAVQSAEAVRRDRAGRVRLR